MGRSSSRTTFSSETGLSRRPPEGSIATRSYGGLLSGSGPETDAGTSSVSQSYRESWPSSRSRTETVISDNARRRSSVSFAEGRTVAPSDSISRVRSGTTCSSHEYSELPPEGTRASGRFSSVSLSHTRASKARSRTVMDRSTVGEPLTKKNLVAYDTAPRSVPAESSGVISEANSSNRTFDRRYSRTPRWYHTDVDEESDERSFADTSRRRPPRYITTTDDGSLTEPERATAKRNFRRPSRRYETVVDDPSQTDIERSSARRGSGRYRRNVDEDSKVDSEATPAQDRRRSSRRYRRAAEDDTQTDWERATYRRSPRGSRWYGSAVDNDRCDEVRSKRARRRSRPVAVESDGSRTPTADPSDPLSASNPPPGTSPTIAASSHTRTKVVDTPSGPDAASPPESIVTARISAASPKEPSAGISKTDAEGRSRRDSLSSTALPSKESFDSHVDGSTAAVSKQMMISPDSKTGSQSQSVAPSKEGNSKSLNPSVPTAPTLSKSDDGPQWLRKLHIAEIRKPDGRIVEDREYTVQRWNGKGIEPVEG